MRKSVLMGLGLALSLAGTVAAQQGQEGQRPRGERGGKVEGRRGPDGLLLKDIVLTEGQRTQIAQLNKTQRVKMDSGRAKGRGQFEDVRAARERGDTAAVRRAMQQRRQVMEQERTQHIAAIRNILTVQQRVQFDKNVAELKQRQADRAQRGEGPGPGRRGGKGQKGGDRGLGAVRPVGFSR
jgi:Spy/CpxP family protein refolding chaperone